MAVTTSSYRFRTTRFTTRFKLQRSQGVGRTEKQMSAFALIKKKAKGAIHNVNTRSAKGRGLVLLSDLLHTRLSQTTFIHTR
eukprot:scaffold386548_cov25-Prasinocladus_malaysianus.AAC.1